YFDKAVEQVEKKQPRHASDEAPKKRSKPVKPVEYDDPDDDDDDEEEEEVSKSSYFVVALTAIAAAVIIIVAVFIAIVVAKNFIHGGDGEVQPMVNLVGQDYREMELKYEDYFRLVVEKEEYNPDFPAGTIISHSPKADSPIMVGNSEVRAVVSKGARMVNVPNTYTIEANAATAMIEAQGLKYSLVMQNSEEEANHVIKTDPERNTLVEAGSTVLVYVSLGPEIYDIVMPDVVGMEVVEAVKLLESKGFTVVSEKEDSVAPANEVTAQSIPALDEAGEPNIVNPKQTVIITYSSGEVPTTQQNIVFAVPEGLEGPAVFNAYVGGNLSGSVTIDNIGYVATISIPVKGQDIQKVVVETVTDDEHTHKIAEYNVDFNTGAITATMFDADLLRTLYAAPEETTEFVPDDIYDIPTIPFETEFVDPADVLNPGGGFWENIGGN
ncbi:MAG: PASTA domain-containing protein, partial [Oscillospiraceae bacterium]|nr:PASTA domain-containing protein [Oscillospiraceae bacterium]